jgi:type IV pilus assembly protein PilA
MPLKSLPKNAVRRISRREAGFTLMELLIVIAIILVIAGIALPRLNKVRMQANETAAVANIGTIHKAQAMYMSSYGRYASSLTELGPPTSGAAGAAGSDLLPRDLASGRKQGYMFKLASTEEGYAVNADPEGFNNTGSKTFFSDHSGVIHENNTKEQATATSPEIGTAAAATGGAAQAPEKK